MAIAHVISPNSQGCFQYGVLSYAASDSELFARRSCELRSSQPARRSPTSGPGITRFRMTVFRRDRAMGFGSLNSLFALGPSGLRCAICGLDIRGRNLELVHLRDDLLYGRRPTVGAQGFGTSL